MVVCMACPACGEIEEFEAIWWRIDEETNVPTEYRLHCPRCEHVWTEIEEDW